jgi:20S proteasome alpha/beta subunit
MSFDEAETLALQTLKQVMEEAITSKNIEVCDLA